MASTPESMPTQGTPVRRGTVICSGRAGGRLTVFHGCTCICWLMVILAYLVDRLGVRFTSDLSSPIDLSPSALTWFSPWVTPK